MHGVAGEETKQLRQKAIEFAPRSPVEESPPARRDENVLTGAQARSALDALRRSVSTLPVDTVFVPKSESPDVTRREDGVHQQPSDDSSHAPISPSVRHGDSFPPVDSAANLVRGASIESLSTHIRPLGQLEDSFIIATDSDGLLLIDQHAAHERILFDKYHQLEAERGAESQNLLIPETFDLTPAQATAFDAVADELEHYGFGLMRLSGRTVAVRAVPADLPAGEARNMLAEVLDARDAEKRGAARANMREEIAVSLACRAAVKPNTTLSMEKMRWLIERLLDTSSPTTCPHGRPTVLRLNVRDIKRGFHRT